ncbi:MAG: LacI family transcriptional regulator [Gammaproteobacteria bacterium]|nr:MAG: LacI family transcriptional regulator [Gammaproteobacteria bacterium]
MAAKLKDVAERAGVSIATVSLIINNKARASSKTIAAVERAMKELNYTPKRRKSKSRGRSMKPDANGLMGDVLITFKSEGGRFWRTPLYSDFVHGVESELTKRGMRTVLYKISKESGEIDYGITESVRGCIAPGYQAYADRMSRSFKRLPTIPVFGMPVPGVDHINADSEEVGRLAAEFFLEHGHRHAAFIVDTAHPVYVQRHDAFIKVFEAGGGRVMTLEGHNFHGHARFGNPESERILSSLARQFAEAKDRPTAFMSPADALTARLNAEWRRQGKDVMKQVAFVTCNNEPEYLEQLDIKPTVIDIHAEEIGARAVNALLYRIEHPDAPPVRIRIAPTLIPGDLPKVK